MTWIVYWEQNRSQSMPVALCPLSWPGIEGPSSPCRATPGSQGECLPISSCPTVLTPPAPSLAALRAHDCLSPASLEALTTNCSSLATCPCLLSAVAHSLLQGETKAVAQGTQAHTMWSPTAFLSSSAPPLSAPRCPLAIWLSPRAWSLARPPLQIPTARLTPTPPASACLEALSQGGHPLHPI